MVVAVVARGCALRSVLLFLCFLSHFLCPSFPWIDPTDVKRISTIFFISLSLSGDMGLWTLLEGLLLLANSLAILNEDRFLAPRGWSFSDFSGGKTKTSKGQLIAGFWMIPRMVDG
ncbi:hypothetical protein K1719_037324 [Acacia pycnantha]|nr:hypothetical protein K1719_037324 [Acacia pycnantha]